ncbi:WD40 repeat domain-containing serine/threonine protein kinase [Dictyobacter arantiisoli]|uniref:Serine/threonine protein kinase n=1 Tax=Dictyobacter arantiisoli TaxID=2014874 RepID=A0A5A5T7Z9_9CHLR|nr:serine/threonine-protein kinase [Dictyobacter arantiisoli]GCF07089.1 serine/threonine protein kinase [Dictyobacter arantiisoli]
MLPSELFCANCGAVNNPQDRDCFACQQPLHQTTAANEPQHTALLRQRYRILERLGQGGMGSVYKAEDTELGNRLVAIKELLQKGLNQQESQEAEKSFKREALLLAGLMHANMPRIYDNFSEAGRWYLVMDFIEGQTLEEYLTSKGGKLPWSEVYEIAIQLCTVLHYLHTRPTPIIFRDLKPLNIMLTPNRQIYLIDFGIARQFKPGQSHDTIAFGSPGYAAPEQYGKAQTGPSADIYSLGAMLHQMLTGIDPSTAPFAFGPVVGAAPDLQNLLNQMLNLNASQRISDAGVVKQRLQEINTTQPIAQNSYTTPVNAPIYIPITQANALPVPQTIQNIATPAPALNPTINPNIISTPPRSTTQGELVYLYPGHTSIVTAIAWSPYGKQIASAAHEKAVHVWEVATGQLEQLYTGNVENWKARSIEALAWSPTGKLIASASNEGIIQVWQVNPLLTKISYDHHKGKVSALAWSPDGRLLASASQQTLQIWQAIDGQIILEQTVDFGMVTSLAWSPDGSLLAVGYQEAVAQIFSFDLQDTKMGHKLMYRGHHGALSKVLWSPDGSQIASGSSDKTIQIWDAETGERVSTYAGHSGPIYALDWSPTGDLIISASADGTMQIWDAQDGQWLYTHPSRNPNVFAVAWSPDGKYIASGAHSKVRVWWAS